MEQGVVNPEFDNDEMKFSGFDFGLDEDDWGRQNSSIDNRFGCKSEDVKS